MAEKIERLRSVKATLGTWTEEDLKEGIPYVTKIT
jgi:hypothetical protein